MPGPAPNPNARRRNARPSGVRLPAEGRRGDPPPWPLAPSVELTVALKVSQAVVDDLGHKDKLTAAEKRKLNKALAQVVEIDTKAELIAEGERTLWTELWKTPQAVAWERYGWWREVALYVRWTVLGEQGDLRAAQEARQWSDRLGLSPMAMKRLQWEITADELAQQRTATPPPRPKRRLKVVDPDVG